MPRQRNVPADHPAFADLPVTLIGSDRPGEFLAVHVSGVLSSRRVPLICVAGYNRNMADFTDLLATLRRDLEEDWPIVLIDLRGRGRSGDRADKARYTSLADAQDLVAIADALGIERGIWLGQGYGGQVVMALNVLHPARVAGAALIDAGPVTDTRGLVRLRGNLRHISQMRGEKALQAAFRQILLADYPDLSDSRLSQLMLRSHAVDKKHRARPLFDQYLATSLDRFEHDDVLVAQWAYFDALGGKPLLLIRTQLSDQLRRETFDEMVRRRPDALSLVIEGQGSPALLDEPAEADAIVSFLRGATRQAGKAAA